MTARSVPPTVLKTQHITLTCTIYCISVAFYACIETMEKSVFTMFFGYCTNHVVAAIVREYVFYVFLRFFENSKNRDFLRFLKCHVKKTLKNVESVIQVFTFLHFKIANEDFHCKTVTHMSCYTYNIVLKLFISG